MQTTLGILETPIAMQLSIHVRIFGLYFIQVLKKKAYIDYKIPLETYFSEHFGVFCIKVMEKTAPTPALIITSAAVSVKSWSIEFIVAFKITIINN